MKSVVYVHYDFYQNKVVAREQLADWILIISQGATNCSIFIVNKDTLVFRLALLKTSKICNLIDLNKLVQIG